MRGQVLWVALLSAAPGDPVLPPGQPVAPVPLPGLAPSPYLPELAPEPFTTPETALRAEPLPLRSARPLPAPPHVALLAPSPYERELLPDPYAGSSTSGAQLAVATTSVVLAGSLEPSALAPSPYEPQPPHELAPCPY